jgi:hypothetical protein
LLTSVYKSTESLPAKWRRNIWYSQRKMNLAEVCQSERDTEWHTEWPKNVSHTALQEAWSPTLMRATANEQSNAFLVRMVIWHSARLQQIDVEIIRGDTTAGFGSLLSRASLVPVWAMAHLVGSLVRRGAAT